MVDLSALNPNQREAASTIEGPVLILAGAGSGKTRTITYRMAHMLNNLNIPAEQILGVTFTNKAAKEMKERLRSLVSAKRRRGIQLSTFHALGIKILNDQIQHLNYRKPYSLYDMSDQVSIIREILKNFKSEKGKYDIKTIQSKMSYLKNKGLDPNQFIQSRLFDESDEYDHATAFVYEKYQEKMHFYNAIDFDDILFLSVKLFKQNPEIAKYYSQKFQYIMIDEYQDTNDLQFQMVNALTSEHQNICVVGDDDQSIYSFRGANITNILNFEKEYSDTKVIKLEQNYRSTDTILNLANEIISKNTKRKEKKLWTETKSNIKPLLWSCDDADHEASLIAEEIIKLQKKGIPLKEISILIRGQKQIPPLEDHLRLQQIPYTVVGGQKFYEKKEVKDLIAYLSVISNPYNELALRRIVNTPNRGIGMTTLKKIMLKQENNKLPLFDLLTEESQNNQSIKKFLELIKNVREQFKRCRIDEATSFLIRETAYKDYIEHIHDNVKQADFRKKDVDTFVESATRFIQHSKGSPNLNEFLSKLLLADAHDRYNEDKSLSYQVTLMTLHSSKGLEYDYVFLAGMEEELLPHKKSIIEGDIDEERRLCYVGVTRARKKLYMSYSKERLMFNKQVARRPSRFIIDLKHLYQQQDCGSFEHLDPNEIEKYKETFFEDLLDSLD